MSIKKFYRVSICTLALTVTATTNLIAQTITSTVTTSAGATFCASNPRKYISQFTWGTNSILKTPTNAVVTPSGAPNVSPQIQQVRNGQVIATYSSFSSNPYTCTYIGDGTDWQHPASPAASGCGPFASGHNFRLWAPGDVFNVAPAIYTGLYNQPYFGPENDGYSSTTPTPMTGITIQGTVTNGYRPVIYYNPSQSDLSGGQNENNTLGQASIYFGVSSGLLWDSIDVFAGPGAASYLGLGTNPNANPNANQTQQAGIYDLGASNFTFSNSRVSGFDIVNYNWYAYELQHNPGFTVEVGADGFFGAGIYAGTTTFYRDEFDHNGGFISNLAHNVYMGASETDPNYTVVLLDSYSHDAWQGHLFKSRAQKNDIESNYLQGGLPQSGLTPASAETYLLDIPYGGVLTVHGNVFAKNASGVNTNGVSIEYGGDGINPNTTSQLSAPAIDFEQNTFGSFAATYDGTNGIYPMLFFAPTSPPTAVVPGTPAFPSNTSVTIQGNLFVDYCASGQPTPNVVDYRGNLAVIAAYGDLNADWLGPQYTFAGTDPFANDHHYRHITNYASKFGTTYIVGAE